MKKSRAFRALMLMAVAAVTLSAMSGCAPHATTQAPAGMSVGQPLTDAQLQAIAQKHAAHKAAQGQGQ